MKFTVSKVRKYNNGMKSERQAYLSQLINNNIKNPRILFSTISSVIDPVRNWKEPSNMPNCEDFVTYFSNKIQSIRADLQQIQPSNICITSPLILSNTLDSFALVDATTLNKIILQLKPATCFLDPIPTSLFKSVFNFLAQEVLNIVNLSLQTGVFPTPLKTAMVKPLLKKDNLDPSLLSNYRPVSNLPFLSKILEKIVFNQINDFMIANNIFEIHQSGFRVHHSTETALVKILDDIRSNMDKKNLSVLVLLDLTAAFDTVDHCILLDRLHYAVGLSGSVFNWFKSFLTNRDFYVSLGEHSSAKCKMECGVPQGSILGPTLFNLYMLPLGQVIRRHGVNFHSYADDTQLYIAVSPDDLSPIDTLFNCILDIKSWMAANFLQLNQGKTEVLIIGPEAQRERLKAKLQTYSLNPCERVKSLGVILDSELSFEPHIRSITKSGFYHLKNIARVRPFLSQASAEILIHAFITNRVDYCNALLSGLPKKSTAPLQLLQNSAARLLTRTRKREHITPSTEVSALASCELQDRF
ncbi:hypothetical protein NL108_017132 [Boleophthalmus pectinirostris]|nr:hypothetical protein NL108_017132 [Boleophthalmus pectinirostris]